MLAQAETLLAQGGSDEAAFALRETERRYLPDTIRAYEDIPPARRDAVAADMLVEQLRLLERATAQRLAVLAETARTALQANGAFLSERFGPIDALPETPPVDVLDPDTAPPAILVRRLLERVEAAAGPQPLALMERIAAQLGAAFPAIVTVRRGGFLGRGPVDEVALDVPRLGDLLRYALLRTPQGGVDASVTRYLRGVKNKSVTVGIGEWTHGLVADLAAYVERERGARDVLARLFRENR